MIIDLDLQMAQLEVKLLRAQFNSHFLFNNLNAINYCILQNDNQKASSYLTLFSRFLRRIAGHSQRDFVKLTDEIETLHQYVQIEKLRFARAIQLVVTVEPGIETDGVLVPSLILHSHIENMIWHNLDARADRGVLTLAVQKKSGKIHILLETNGASSETTDLRAKPGARESKLELTVKRLQLLNERHGTDLELRMTKKDAFRKIIGVDLSFSPFASQTLP
ncbi:sensor histidine kinase [Persicitalea jodogahamensis]|uniref:Signal transduction histidine kinase internal region domain-containing protein n=1 Tax=Persicitalea jodogahamensis TaxID=402147 RepID=A0A8J3DCI0_9BACT|nr:histidine kinase [Persicitalea jodogahamensis]GHB76670.1 hypothetical protein GCM10007390_33290 [Persicitalea jodogahamensis]